MSSDNRIERNRSRVIQNLFVYNPVRVFLQRKIEAPRVLTGFRLPPRPHCIEIGCGHGAGTLLISRHFDCARIVGVDNDPQVIERARSFVLHPPVWARGVRTDHIELTCVDAARLPYEEHSFDAAFLFAVLNSAEAWKDIVAEVARVLKPGGIFSFKEAVRPVVVSRLSRLYLFMPVIGEDELQDHLIRTGFAIERYAATRRLPRVFVRARKRGA